MSNSQQTASNGTVTATNTRVPRAVIHKQILDVAASKPDASMNAIADEVSGATTELVEKVFDEYGDPGESADNEPDNPVVTADTTVDSPVADEASSEEQPSEASDDDPPTLEFDGDQSPPKSEDEGDSKETVATTNSTVTPSELEASESSRENTIDGQTADTAEDAVDASTSDPDVPDPATLTDTQLETLRVIHDRPDATQAELASVFDITSASVSQRVNSIDGFEWENRRAFTNTLFDTSGVDDRTPIEPDGGTDTSFSEGPNVTMTDVEKTADSDESNTTDENTTMTTESDTTMKPDSTEQEQTCDCAEQLAAVADQVDRLEEQLTNRSQSHSGSLVDDPELAHKVVHACLQSDQISKDEELQLLQNMMGTPEE